MTQQLILRIKQDGKPRCLHQFDAQSNSCDTKVINDWSDNSLSGKEVLVLLPATWVYHSSTDIASKNAELLTKSIPFAIEEELSNEVDENYFAFNLLNDDSQNVVAIEKKYLDELLIHLKAAKVQAKAIYSEIDWLPTANKTAYLWQDENSTLVRFEYDQALRVANNQLEQMFSVFGSNINQIVTNKNTVFNSINTETISSLTALQCCENLIQADPVNLFVDAVKSDKNTKNTQNWRTVKWLATALILSWTAISLFQLIKLNGAVAELKSKQQEIFTQRFSDAAASELVDPYAAYQSRLQLQSASNMNQSNILIETLNALGITLRNEQLITIKGLRLIDEKIEIQVNAPAMSTINGFHQQLQQNADSYTVQIGVNELADDASFRSIITMVPR